MNVNITIVSNHLDPLMPNALQRNVTSSKPSTVGSVLPASAIEERLVQLLLPFENDPFSRNDKHGMSNYERIRRISRMSDSKPAIVRSY